MFSLVGLGALFGAVFLFSPRVDYQNPERLRPFGTRLFEPHLWKGGDPGQRGAMLFDFVRSGRWKGQSRSVLEGWLGAPTARYLSPDNLAYQVGPPGVKSRFGDRYTFSLVWNPKTSAYDHFWIEPFPEEFPPASGAPAP